MRRQLFLIRRGMTLVEMLVAMAASLLLMAAVARAFAAFSGAMSNSRAILETDARLRSAAHRLRTDLQGVTTQMLPPRNPAQGEGYFEVIEGPLTDYQDSTIPVAPVAIVSGTTTVCPTDIDDVLLFTTRNTDTPFIGRVGSETMESSTAEVAWFARATPGTTGPVTYTLYRKQLLVMGYMDPPASLTPPFRAANFNRLTFSSWAGFYADWPADISVRREVGVGFDVLTPNNLNDLTRRESRFLHNPTGNASVTAFPYSFVAHQSSTPDGLTFDGTIREGEDIVLTNLLAFDVRVFDPGAAVEVTGGTALAPGDDVNLDGTLNAADTSAFGAASVGSGAYVDLGNAISANSVSGVTPMFNGFGTSLSGLVGSASTRRTYDTWSTHYEANGLNEDGDALTDEGTDGLDNTPVNSLVDESTEQETSPPYPYPLRGVEVRIRVYEPSSRQVRQVTVRHTFVPH